LLCLKGVVRVSAISRLAQEDLIGVALRAVGLIAASVDCV
jgi:hypothetical protein